MPRLTADATIVGAADLAARAMGFLASVHLASTLGRYRFGAVTIGLALLSYAIWFADLGLGALGTRETARAIGARRFAPSTIAAARLLSGIVVVLMAELLVYLFVGDAALRTLLALFVLALLPAIISIEWLHQGRRQFGPVAAARVVNGLIFLAGVWLLVTSHEDLERVPVVYGAGFAGAAAILLFVSRGEERVVPRKGEWGRVLPAWRTASAIGVGGLFAQSVQLFPPIALGWFSMDQAGLLGGATKVVFAALLIDRVFGSLFLPAISSLWTRDRAAAERNLRIVQRLMMALAFITATVITLVARPLMLILFGPEYAEGDVALAVLGWFVAATLVNSLYSFGLIAIGREREYLQATVAGGVTAALASVLLAREYGSIGAALGMTVGEIVLVIYAWRAFNAQIPMGILRPLLAGIVVAAIVIVPFRLLDVESFWLFGIVPPLQAALILACRGLYMDDLRWALKR